VGDGERGLARRDFVVEVAWHHHELGLDQRTLAEQFNVSRSTISRALTEAEGLGIVQVVLTEPRPQDARLAAILRDRFAISAHVSGRLLDETSIRAVARGTARLIEQIAATGRLSIAASWGRTLALAAHLVRPRSAPDVMVIDAIGHARGGQMAPSIDVTNTLAAALGASATHLGTPAFAGSPDAYAVLISSPPVDHVLRLARQAEVVLISIGVTGERSLLRQEGLVDAETMVSLVQRGAIGEILGQYYDVSGTLIRDPSIMPIGLTLDDLRHGRRVIVAAGGADKAPALLAAIAGGIVDEIVVDDDLGQALLHVPDHPTGGS